MIANPVARSPKRRRYGQGKEPWYLRSVPESVSIEEAEADFFGLLARVENGEEFVITRDGKPIVLFGPPKESADPSPPR
jgi:hypothetical protein